VKQRCQGDMAAGTCCVWRQVYGRSSVELVRVVALAWPPSMPVPSCLMSSTINLQRGASKRPPLFNLSFTICVMATSARFASSLRRSALSARVAPRAQCLRLAPQVRRITSATSEPHQPDSKGGLDGPAPSKTIKFTSESYVASSGNNFQD
jgi:hypothetical protein